MVPALLFLLQVFRSFIQLLLPRGGRFTSPICSLCHGGVSVLLSDWSKVDLNSILLTVLPVMGELQVLLSHWEKIPVFSSVSQHHFFQLFFQLSPICCLTISAPSSLSTVPLTPDRGFQFFYVSLTPPSPPHHFFSLQSSVELVWRSDSHVCSILWARVSSLLYLMQQHGVE